MAQLELADLVAPMSPQQFVHDVLGRSVLHMPGAADRFVPLFPWSRLNEIVASARMDYPRIRLVKGKTSLPREAFLSYESIPGASKAPRVVTTKMIHELRAGATLVVDAVQEFSEPLQRL